MGLIQKNYMEVKNKSIIVIVNNDSLKEQHHENNFIRCHKSILIDIIMMFVLDIEKITSKTYEKVAIALA